MKRGRLIVTDAAKQLGTICVPLIDGSSPTNWSTMTGYILSVTHPVLNEQTFVNDIVSGVGTGASGSAPNVTDVTALVFDSMGPFGLRVPLYGAYGIFEGDGVTVDISITAVANMIAWMLAFGLDNDGNPLVSYKYGRRLS